jgi:predicted TIM-barrel fold metal-dependent hydrolase
MERLPNAYIETSVQPIRGYKEGKEIVAALRTFGIDRVLLGSDWPVYHPAETLAYMKEMPFTEAELNQIIQGNGKRLFPY